MANKKLKPFSKNYNFQDSEINETLFETYYPHLKFNDYRDSDMWHDIVRMDLDLSPYLDEELEHEIVFEGEYEQNKYLGPVG